MAVIVRTLSATMALPMVWPVFARRRMSPKIAYMLSLAVLSPAPKYNRIFKSLICGAAGNHEHRRPIIFAQINMRSSLMAGRTWMNGAGVLW